MRGSREISLVPSLHRVSTDALIVASNTCVLLSVHYKMESYCTFHTMNQSLQLVVNHYLCRYSVLLTRA